MTDLPPEFDPAFYRAGNPDLAALNDRPLIDHYRRWGANEGRVASPLATREGLLAEIATRENGRVLEIGPGCAPVMIGAKVRYLDGITGDLLGNGAPHIHYVGKVDALPRSFDATVACRSIGHHPDLIGHLQEIGRVLIEGGLYYLIVPTAAAPHATAADAIAAHREQRLTHSLATRIAACERRRDDATSTIRARRIADAIEEHEATTAYRDAEAWHFTPAVFRDLLTLLHDLALSPFVPARIWPTPAGRDEFCAILERA